MKKVLSLSAGFLALSSLPLMAEEALEIVGKPVSGKMGFQPPATELARKLQWLDHTLLIIIAAITLLVIGLILWVIVRYNRRANPTPARFTHHSAIEILWTVVPIVILAFIGAISLPVLFQQQEIPEADITIKVTGYQWYWGYEYVDAGFSFDSYMIGQPATGGNYMLTPEVEAKLVEAGYSRDEFLLATDNAVVVPVNKIVVMNVTGADVIHSWAMPAFGVKQDGVPGRLAQLWFKAEREGIYFGQCSELCGKDHAFMPITVKVVSQEAYDKWLEKAIEEYAGTPAAPASYQVAAN
ncbi:cytochrome c oxidase subunit II [Pseudodonghicola sp.]|uniref:cytochrome c oxidase subunit II n=1 Tax=Pseudodonghicola sp. TaxID=1969463 RepID=UPI003A9885C4